jgi:hypothetical protein
MATIETPISKPLRLPAAESLQRFSWRWQQLNSQCVQNEGQIMGPTFRVKFRQEDIYAFSERSLGKSVGAYGRI